MPLNEWEILDSLECHTPKSGEKGEGEGTGCKCSRSRQERSAGYLGEWLIGEKPQAGDSAIKLERHSVSI